MIYHGTWREPVPFDNSIFRVRDEDGKHWYTLLYVDQQWPIVNGVDVTGTTKFTVTIEPDRSYVSSYFTDATGFASPPVYALFEVEDGDPFYYIGEYGTVANGVFTSVNEG